MVLIARTNRCKMGRDRYEDFPAFGYCATQQMYYYGYKLHAVCSTRGIIHSYDLTPANVHDICYLSDVKWEYHDCLLLGDKGYLSAKVQLDLFESANIELEVPYRLNQKDWTPVSWRYKRFRKRVEKVHNPADSRPLDPVILGHLC